VSPHKLLLGLEPQVNVKFLSDIAPTAVDRLHTLEEARKEAQTQLETLQKSKDDCKPRQLTQGDDMWLKAKNLTIKGEETPTQTIWTLQSSRMHRTGCISAEAPRDHEDT